MEIYCPSSLAAQRSSQNFPVVENRESENSTDESTAVLERNSGKRDHWAFQNSQDTGDILGKIAGTVYHCRRLM